MIRRKVRRNSPAKEWAKAICQVGPVAVRAVKQAMIRGYSMPLEDGLRLESSLLGYLLGTEDYTEGCAAFIKKRGPNFKTK